MRSVTLFIILVSLSALLSLAISEFVLTDDVLYYSFSDQLSNERIEKFLEERQEWVWVSYVFIPVFYGIKIFVVSVCLFIGIFLFDNKPRFSALFKISLKAEFVLLFPALLVLIRFTLLRDDYTLADVSAFAPLSLLSFFNNEIDFWLKYPLKVLNLFELGYMLMLAFGISEELELDFYNSFKRVFFSYGTGLVLWIMFIVFLMVNAGG